MCKKSIWKKIVEPRGNPKETLKNTITFNLALFSVLVAFYIAVSSYYLPQIQQLDLDIKSNFNRMLSDIDIAVPLDSSYNDYYQEFYTNDTIDIIKVFERFKFGSDFGAMVYHSHHLNDKKFFASTANEVIESWSVLNLVGSQPYLDTIRTSENLIFNYPFDTKLYDEIEYLLREIMNYRHFNAGYDINLLRLSLGHSFSSLDPIRTSGQTIRRDVWINDLIDSLRQNPTAGSEYQISFYEKIILLDNAKKQRFINIYSSLNSTYRTYVSKIDDLLFKKKSYSRFLSIVYNLKVFYWLLIILIWNILLPIFYLNLKKINGKLALIHMLVGLIPYVFIINYSFVNFII